ncbi:hypothetical protein NP233_g4773 [Leucocoprinus birnbaumii]|uniref:Uncharacterized protein n=1 Tax=Leucocoprinus birnbaumii TaxID=56174 RepID=A0AAD5VVF8_9AGAR|nr:hypothetical protein NP233_g4773 [Leucocoprinus birnbaumii]
MRPIQRLSVAARLVGQRPPASPRAPASALRKHYAATAVRGILTSLYQKCTRCTSSISATNRATNGHRFVFHSSEVVGMERHYIQDEPGVIPYEPTGVTAAASGSTSTATGSVPELSSPREIHVSLPRPHTRSGSPGLESIPPPTLEPANPLAGLSSTDLSSPAVNSYPRSSDSRSAGGRRTAASQATQSPPSYSSTNFMDSSPPPLVSATFSNMMNAGPGVPPEQKDLPTSRALKPGDVLFWHHLTRCGEIPGVEDDKRARSKASARGTAKNNVRSSNMERRGRSLGRVVFGR